MVHLDTGALMIATGGLQAPTIRHHDGRFYIICTNIRRRATSPLLRENFIISTTDPWDGTWSDPMFFDFNGIDTSLFVDDDGRTYIQGAWMHDREEQPHSSIYQLELDLDTGTALSEPRSIWEGHFQYDTEGPHVYKRNGWYYLVAAEGGTFEHHKLSVARAKDIWGPYESYQKNPILTSEATAGEIQGLGHGELFQDGDGDWWIVALGFRSRDGVWPLGRESFLAKVDWPKGGWPQVELPRTSFRGKRIQACAEMPRGKSVSDIVHIRGREEGTFRVKGEGENVVIQLRPGVVGLGDSEGIPSFFGRRQEELSGSAEATLVISNMDAVVTAEIKAGMALYLDPLRYASLAYDFANCRMQLKIVNKPRGFSQETTYEVSSEVGAVNFRIESTDEKYIFLFQTRHTTGAGGDGLDRTWRTAGSVKMADIWARFFTGPILGIFAHGQFAGEPAEVTFSGFKTSFPSVADADADGSVEHPGTSRCVVS